MEKSGVRLSEENPSTNDFVWFELSGGSRNQDFNVLIVLINLFVLATGIVQMPLAIEDIPSKSEVKGDKEEEEKEIKLESEDETDTTLLKNDKQKTLIMR